MTRTSTVADPQREKAQKFFDQGEKVAGTGNYDYAIEMYLGGLKLDIENVDAHKALREISLKRKVTGGKGLGMGDKFKLSRGSKDDNEALLMAEKLLAFDPGNMDSMLAIAQAAGRAGYLDVVLWIGPELYRTNRDNPKGPEFKKFIALKDVYKSLGEWKLATESCQAAVMLKPDDMDLTTELKHLGAQETMKAGSYEGGGSFTKSVRNMEEQKKLFDADKDVRNMDIMTQAIVQAEAEWKAEPNERGKLMKLVEALVKTEQTDNENRAIELLEEAHKRTGQFNFRQSIGKIKLSQLSRMERTMRADVAANPKDTKLAEQYNAFRKEKVQEELDEYLLWAENYPTDISFKFEAAKRMFSLGKYDEAIPVFQQARNDPKYRSVATVSLGRSFLEAGFVDEAADTLKGVIDEYQARGDDRSKEMYYWYARTLEQKGDLDPALKAYSQVAQWDFNYRDVQQRIKALRAKKNNGGQPPSPPAT